MKNLTTGQFYGQTNQTLLLDGLTLTDTVYTHPKVDWHYHENAYFTFILQGNVIEGNKKETYNLSAGNLLFHNWQEAHYNIKPAGFTRGFHIELDQAWAKGLELDLFSIQGSLNIRNPEIKILMHRIFRESKINDATSNLAIHALLLELLGQMTYNCKVSARKTPSWVKELRHLLSDTSTANWKLTELSDILSIHPVHLSRDFTKYFHCTLGEYIRKLKVEQSLCLLLDKNLSLTDVALACGFADQSHFIRTFKSIIHLKPSQYRKLLENKYRC